MGLIHSINEVKKNVYEILLELGIMSQDHCPSLDHKIPQHWENMFEMLEIFIIFQVYQQNFYFFRHVGLLNLLPVFFRDSHQKVNDCLVKQP